MIREHRLFGIKGRLEELHEGDQTTRKMEPSGYTSLSKQSCVSGTQMGSSINREPNL